MVERRTGFGFTLDVDPAGGSSFTTVGGIVNFNGTEASRSDVDVTLLADTFMQFRGAQVDGGTLEFDVALDPNDAESKTIVSLFHRNANDIVPNWKITHSTLTGSTLAVPTRTFRGYVNKLSDVFEKESLATRTVGVKVTDNTGFTT